MKQVQFRSADRLLVLPGKTALKDFICELFQKEKRELGSITYVFCSDKFLLKINQDFLQHDYYTDIISFELSDKRDPAEAEIYISIDRVKENAKTLGVSFKQEVLRVIFHGALHICGYKDKSRAEQQIMRKKEDTYIGLFTK